MGETKPLTPDRITELRARFPSLRGEPDQGAIMQALDFMDQIITENARLEAENATLRERDAEREKRQKFIATIQATPEDAPEGVAPEQVDAWVSGYNSGIADVAGIFDLPYRTPPPPAREGVEDE